MSAELLAVTIILDVVCRSAHMSLQGLGTVQSCEVAANAFKAVAERGDWAKTMTIANRKYLAGDRCCRQTQRIPNPHIPISLLN